MDRPTDLMECPFCGAKPEREYGVIGIWNIFHVQGCYLYDGDHAASLVDGMQTEMWNRRAYSPLLTTLKGD